MTKRSLVVLLIGASCIVSAAGPATIAVDTPMAAPPWARLERQILAANVPACREFFQKYYDDRGYLQAFLRWGANDGPDDALRELQPMARASRARRGRRDPAAVPEGLGRHDAPGTPRRRRATCPPAATACMCKDFSAQSDWMHHGEGLQLFNRMALSAPDLPAYRERARAIRRPLHGRGSPRPRTTTPTAS